ncbi:MAG: glycosyltransferase [Bacteroidales bacterium]|nr:glycosyltransferase [Bacteroidales bacterium]
MTIIRLLIQIAEVILLSYLGFAAFYIFLFSFAGRIGYRFGNATLNNIRKIAVLIPGYKEDNVIVDVAYDALNQDFPKNSYDVIIIADSFKKETIEKLKALPVRTIEVSFEKSTKSKALNKAMEIIGDDYDVAVVLDADNLMERSFLSKINRSFGRGFLTVQGHRVAKNLNTNMAVLDAISEEVNNHIYRLGHRALGLSSALIGSGMAFDYAFFKTTMKEVNAVGGFDKELELRLLQQGKKIEYLNDAIVYDEKVQNKEVFQNQRKRWLSAQFVYFRRYALAGIKELILRGNIDFLDKVYQMIQPPRILLLGITFIISFVMFLSNLLFPTFVETWLFIPPNWWHIVFLTTVLAFILAIPLKFYHWKTMKAVLSLPLSFWIMFTSLFKLKGANKKFIHTQHGTQN